MLVIGITGGIACGKSTVARMFGRLGAEIIDADRIAHSVIEPGTSAWQRVVDEFGRGILNKNLAVNRRKLGRIIFADSEKRRKLEEIIHPRVIEIIKKTAARTRKSAASVKKQQSASGLELSAIIIDAPLLIEANLVSLVEKLVVVTASRKTQIVRLRRSGLTEGEAIRRIDSQMSLREKEALADYVIRNDGNLKETARQVREIWKQINKYDGTVPGTVK
ncbi:dephospho-CoA kinase [candidate division NPL-UPA2 bacterium]|nr:dephospho-CoA kinase [candidate division NPL-UPA2 bacterium]